MLAQAICIHKNGGPEELCLETMEVGAPGHNEVLLRHTAIGVNFTDIHHRTGRYPSQGFPFVPGMEGVGVVEDLGPDVTEVQSADRVAYAGSTPSLAPGSYSQWRILKADRLVKLPDWLDDESAAAVFLKGLTAQYLIRGAYRVQKGDTVLIHAAAGGVGSILCQWTHHQGAAVIGTVSTPEKAAFARQNGCDHPIISTQEDVLSRVWELTSWKGVSVVYDSVGASTFEISLASARRRGMVVSFGSASGPVPPSDIFRLNRMGSLHLTSVGLADYISERSELLERANELFDAIAAGVVQVRISHRYPLAEASSAHRELEGRRTTGSCILLP